MTLAAIMAGFRVTRQELKDLRMVIFGAGTAGVGIADQVRDAIVTEYGLSAEDAASKIWYVPDLVDAKLELTIDQAPRQARTSHDRS